MGGAKVFPYFSTGLNYCHQRAKRDMVWEVRVETPPDSRRNATVSKHHLLTRPR